MNRFFIFFVAAVVFAACGSSSADDSGVSDSCGSSADSTLRVMSFNIRYDNPWDSANDWRYRADRVSDAINFYSADIIGTQEVLYNQLADLRLRLKGYDMVGVGREDGQQQGEYAALWYDTSRFELVDSGNFWLSETPDVAGSMGWDGACVRIATWAKLRDRNSGSSIMALNTHLDHVGETARREGVTLILNRVSELRDGLPVVVTGDFNSTPESDVIAHITGDSIPGHLTNARSAAQLVYGPSWSYHEFGKLPLDRRTLIDYIFVDGPLMVESFGVLAETNDDRWLSDHCPVLANIIWR